MAGLLNSFAVEALLAEVRAERVRQDEKWGEQNHRDGTGPDTLPLALFDSMMTATELADAAREYTDAASSEGMVSFADILREEVFEALAEHEPDLLRRELIEVAAVAIGWVEKVDRARRGAVA